MQALSIAQAAWDNMAPEYPDEPDSSEIYEALTGQMLYVDFMSMWDSKPMYEFQDAVFTDMDATQELLALIHKHADPESVLRAALIKLAADLTEEP